jgi:hypothetical protein
MNENTSLANKLQIMAEEQVVTKFEANIKLQITKGGLFGKKWLVGDDQNTVPALFLLTNQRVIFLAQYTTQRRLVVALVVPIPTGKKHEHSLYAELAIAAYQSMNTGWLNGAELTFAAHGVMQQQYPGYGAFTLFLPDINKKGATAVGEALGKLKSGAQSLPNSGRCELE